MKIKIKELSRKISWEYSTSFIILQDEHLMEFYSTPQFIKELTKKKNLQFGKETNEAESI